jgi:hypothetical protein
MARRTQTYAIRLAVEGGGQVKAELVSVGQSGEQSLKRIETAGERASGGLKGLGRQLRAHDGSNAQQLDQLIAQSAAVRDAQLSQLRPRQGRR